MTTPLVLPPLEVEICWAKANIYYFDWLKCLTALARVFMTFVNPIPYLRFAIVDYSIAFRLIELHVLLFEHY